MSSSLFSQYTSQAPVPTQEDDLGDYIPEYRGIEGNAPFAWVRLSDRDYQESVQAARDELKERGQTIDNTTCISHAEDLETRVQWQLLWRAMRDVHRKGPTLADPYPHKLARSVEELAAHLPTRARVALVQRYTDWTRDLAPTEFCSLAPEELRQLVLQLRSNPQVVARQLSPNDLRSFAISVLDRINLA